MVYVELLQTKKSCGAFCVYIAAVHAGWTITPKYNDFCANLRKLVRKHGYSTRGEGACHGITGILVNPALNTTHTVLLMSILLNDDNNDVD